ncbi:MAG: alpha/beta fold hydrolase [Pseudomonadota bacterium]
MSANNILLLPGWQNSGPDHWQSLWEARHGYRRVEQHDWMRPLRGDWIAQLEEVVLSLDTEKDGPIVLVAHSLGCMLAAAWAAHSRNTTRVKAAFLVAPGDPEREELRPLLSSWTPVERAHLPFSCELLGSQNDPYCSRDRAQGFAHSWGAEFVDAGRLGHINSESGLGEWPEGHARLEALIARA